MVSPISFNGVLTGAPPGRGAGVGTVIHQIAARNRTFIDLDDPAPNLHGPFFSVRAVGQLQLTQRFKEISMAIESQI